MKRKHLLLVAILLLMGMSVAAYSTPNPPLTNYDPSVSATTPSTSNTPRTDTGTCITGMKTMQEQCITRMTDMGMPDWMIQRVAEMMDSMMGSAANMMSGGMGMGGRGGCMMGR